MWMLSHGLTKFFDVLLIPFASLPALVGLAWISLLTGVGMLMVYRHISDQDKIKHVKNRIKAHFLEIRLFKEDMVIGLRAQKNILINNFKYMGLALKPMLFMLPPIILVLVQLEVRYGYRSFQPGDTSVLSVRLASDPTQLGTIDLKVPEGIEIQTPAVRTVESGHYGVDWRIGVTQRGNHDVSVQIGDQTYSKRLCAISRTTAMAPQVGTSSLKETIFQPVERPFDPKGQVQSISIQYPPADMRLLGIHVNWLVGFFVLSIIFGFMLKGVFKVEI